MCENFLGQGFKNWYQSEDAQNFKGTEAVCYGIVNDLDDDTVEELKAWMELNFIHVCGKAPNGP